MSLNQNEAAVRMQCLFRQVHAKEVLYNLMLAEFEEDDYFQCMPLPDVFPQEFTSSVIRKIVMDEAKYYNRLLHTGKILPRQMEKNSIAYACIMGIGDDEGLICDRIEQSVRSTRYLTAPPRAELIDTVRDLMECFWDIWDEINHR